MGDVTFSAGSLAIIAALLSALVTCIGVLFRALMASRDAAMKDMVNQRDSYQKMAAQSIAALELAANRARRARGEPAFQVIPNVVADHNSPTTEKQAAQADYQTLLARGTRAARLLDLPPLSTLPDGVNPSAPDTTDTPPDPVMEGDVDGPVPTNVMVVAESADVRLKVGETVSITAEPVQLDQP
jgi:hypothetical protein